MKENNQNHLSDLYFSCIYLLLLLLVLQSLPNAAAQINNTQPPPVDPYGFSANFSPSMVIILIVLISAFFFMGFFSIYIRQCAENSSGGSVRATFLGGGMSRRGANRGLDAAVIDTFPTFEYKVVKGLKLGKGALECAVCLNEFEDDEMIRLLPKCDHAFHPECIDAWLATHTTCPVCRADLVPVPGETTTATPAADVVPVEELESTSERGTRRSEPAVDAQNEELEVSVHVITEEEEEPSRPVAPEVINPIQTPMQNRPTRSRSTRPRYDASRFPRSHSTGHSLVQPGEDMERFTLRLPDEVRKQIMSKKLDRTRSMVVFPRAGSSRRGYRMSGEGSGRGTRFQRLELGEKAEGWVFSMTPPFFMRASSVRSQKTTTVEGDSSVTAAAPAPPPPLPPRPFSLKSSLRGSRRSDESSLRGSRRSDGTGQSSSRPPV